MATGARFTWWAFGVTKLVAPRRLRKPHRTLKMGPKLLLVLAIVSIAANQCQASTSTTTTAATTRHQQQATSYLPSNHRPPHPTPAASLQAQQQQTTTRASHGSGIVILDQSQASRRKLASEKGGSQQQKDKQVVDKMTRRMEGSNGMPELTIEDETAGDSFLTTEETYEGGTNPSTATEDSQTSSSSFAPDYESDGDTVLEMTTTSISAGPQHQRNHQPPRQHQQISRPLRQSGGQQQPAARLPIVMSSTPQSVAQQQQQSSLLMQQPTMAPSNHRLAASSFQAPTVRSAAAIAMPMPVPIATTTMATTTGGQFNVNMGADRMMIKPHHGRHQDHHLHQEMATESINHEMRAAHNANHQLLAPLGDDRRQEFLYPTPADLRHLRGLPNHLADGLHSMASASSPVAAASAPTTICYTPFGLLLVIMLTMFVTILVCFATHYLLRHLGRRQFDLIANSKLFETKHRSGYLEGGNERRRFMSANNSAAARCAGMQVDAIQDRREMLFQHHLNEEQSAEGKSLQRLRDEHGCAFDNPYFRDEQQASSMAATQLRQSAKSLARYQAQEPNNGNLATANQQQQQEANTGNGSHRNEQLNFIEHHISNLHNRQVTSSVKELSVLGSPSPHVVDLTNEEQRAKVIADPKEGDLIAVDITGHDFIGLGFDVCGGHNEGIFVRSVLSRGPARESGCIQAGDRIKCLNISFDQMTLQDATDILNSGSPYKLRLLLEKRATKAGDNKLRQPPAPILMRRNHRYYNQATNSNYLNQNYLMAADLHHYQHHLLHHQHSTGGFFKSYLRRLANFVAPSNRNNLSSPDYGGRRPVADLAMSSPDGAPPYYLGSATARRHLLQGRQNVGSGGTLPTSGPQALHLAAHLNSGYGSDGDDNNQLMGDHFAQVSRRRSVGSLGAHRNQFDATNRQSFDSQHQHMFGGESQPELNDMSLDNYQHRNAHHKLHGPPGQLFDSDHLRYPSRDPLRVTSHSVHDNLEQTRSQPEIARGLGQDHGHHNPVMLHSTKHQTSADISKQHHSTPAMNLFDEKQEQWRQAKSGTKEVSVGSESSFADSTSKLVSHQRQASSSASSSSVASSSQAASSTPTTATPTGSISASAATAAASTKAADEDAAGKVPAEKSNHKENNRGREDAGTSKADRANNSRA